MTMPTTPVALVTGASRGIGRAIAQSLARRGVHVAIGFHRGEEAAQNLLEELQNEGLEASLARANVADKQEVKQMVRAIKKQLGRLDILVNNAGILEEQLFFLTSTDRFWEVQNTNLGGVVNCCRASIPMLSKYRQGRIINLSSLAASHGTAGLSAYACSKAAIEALTKVLARELAAMGVRVNAVAPGLVATEMTANLRNPDHQQQMLQTQPVSRMGRPEEVANLVTYLALEAPDYLTGEVLRIAGGFI